MNRIARYIAGRPAIARALFAAPEPTAFVAMLWRYAKLFEAISAAATRRGLPTRALRAAAVAAALADMARSETDSTISTEGDDDVR